MYRHLEIKGTISTPFLHARAAPLIKAERNPSPNNFDGDLNQGKLAKLDKIWAKTADFNGLCLLGYPGHNL